MFSLSWGCKIWLLLLQGHFSLVRLCATPIRQPTRLLRPWDSPGKNTGVGCHFLLQATSLWKGSALPSLAVSPTWINFILLSFLPHVWKFFSNPCTAHDTSLSSGFSIFAVRTLPTENKQAQEVLLHCTGQTPVNRTLPQGLGVLGVLGGGLLESAMVYQRGISALDSSPLLLPGCLCIWQVWGWMHGMQQWRRGGNSHLTRTHCLYWALSHKGWGWGAAL